jgi:glycosyltransferase involved in cell wall biosynthesis
MLVLIFTYSASPKEFQGMIAIMPTVSVIVPSHNRCVLLRKIFEGIGLQTYPLSLIELIVVADGCNDGTSEMIRLCELPFALRLVEQQRQGPAAARNRGAAASSGKLLVFLDDDVLPAPRLIEAHVRAHGKSTPQVAVGYSPLVFEGRGDFFRLGMRSWWENEYSAMRRPGYRYTYRSLFSGNFSLEAELFNRMGGFDATLPRHEDYEFGLRLLKANVSFAFVADAIGYHHDTSDLYGSLSRAYQEGRGDVRIGFSHPELHRTIQLAQLAELRMLVYRMVFILAFDHRKTGDALAFVLRQALGVIERLRIRRLWRKIYIGLRAYWYLRGAAEELGTPEQLRWFLQNGRANNDAGRAEIEIDLREGIVLAERKLDQERPDGVRIRYGQQMVGRIPVQEGAERLSGRHLRHFLAKTLSRPLIRAIIVENTFENAQRSNASILTAFDGLRTGSNKE